MRRTKNWKKEAVSLTDIMDRNRTARHELLLNFNNGAIDWDTCAKGIVALDNELNLAYYRWLSEMQVIVGPPDDTVDPEFLLEVSPN